MRRPGWLRRSPRLATAVIGAILFIPVAFTLRGTVKPIEAYRSTDADTIAVLVTHGCCSWLHVGGLDQTEDVVRVEVRESKIPIGNALIGLQSWVVVDLDAPLGDRRVIDAGSARDLPRDGAP